MSIIKISEEKNTKFLLEKITYKVILNKDDNFNETVQKLIDVVNNYKESNYKIGTKLIFDEKIIQIAFKDKIYLNDILNKFEIIAQSNKEININNFIATFTYFKKKCQINVL